MSDGAESGEIRVEGELAAVLSGHLSGLLVAPTDRGWVLVRAGEFETAEVPTVDLTRRVARVAVAATVPAFRLLTSVSTERVQDLAVVMFAADAVGASQCAWTRLRTTRVTGASSDGPSASSKE